MTTDIRYQTATMPPSATGNQSDIISAAEGRAAFWGYPSQGPWTVPVSVGKKTVHVRRGDNGSTTVGQPS